MFNVVLAKGIPPLLKNWMLLITLPCTTVEWWNKFRDHSGHKHGFYSNKGFPMSGDTRYRQGRKASWKGATSGSNVKQHLSFHCRFSFLFFPTFKADDCNIRPERFLRWCLVSRSDCKWLTASSEKLFHGFVLCLWVHANFGHPCLWAGAHTGDAQGVLSAEPVSYYFHLPVPHSSTRSILLILSFNAFSWFH